MLIKDIRYGARMLVQNPGFRAFEWVKADGLND